MVRVNVRVRFRVYLSGLVLFSIKPTALSSCVTVTPQVAYQ